MTFLHLPNSRHPYHLVDPSPWPILVAFSVFILVTGFVLSFHFFDKATFIWVSGFFLFVLSLTFWWRDVVREACYEGSHTLAVQKGLKLGMALYVISEVSFFAGFFWAWFHSGLSPSPEIGAVWPPVGLQVFNCWEIPFLNTLILLLSGASVTWSHHSLILGSKEQTVQGLWVTVLLAFVFIILQGFEYVHSSFTIGDSVYGSTFYVATGFHGLHVILGAIFLSVALCRTMRGQLTREHHNGFEFAVIFWHVVDVIWIFLFVAVYYWAGN